VSDATRRRRWPSLVVVACVFAQREHVSMPQSFVLNLSQKRLDLLKKDGEVGTSLTMMYGSPHASAPSFRRYGVGPGDFVYIVGLKAGLLSLVTRVEVDGLITAYDYFRDHLKLPEKLLKMHLWDMSEKLWDERRELGHRLPFGCVDEVALFSSATPVTLDRTIPTEVTAALRFRTKKGEERSLPLQGGLLKKLSALQAHIHRLTPETAPLLERLLRPGRARKATAGRKA
jgi:hypothetical protein